MVKPTSGKIELLLVEDDEDFRAALMARLAKRDFEVTAVASSEAAIGKCRRSKFDAVIVDIKLPGMDGIEFLAKVREINKDLPVILVTGYASLESAKEAVKLNASDYLLKPLEGIDELLAPINKAVHGYRLLIENRKLTEDMRKKMEELEKSEQMYRNLFELASDIICVVDYEGKIISANRRMEDITGYSKKELIGMEAAEVLTCVSEEENRRNMQDMIEGRVIDLVDVKIITKSGGHRLGEMSVSLIEEGVKITGLQYVIRDVTERKKAEETQRLARLGELAASMAHEVNNPLQIISGRAQLSLMEDPPNEEVKKDLEIIMDQCDRAKNIIQRLLMFSKPSRGELKEASLHNIIDLVTDLVEHQYSLKNVKVKRDYKILLPKVRVDEKQMQEVFMNLLKNALDSMPEGGTITISVGKQGDKVRVDFEDDGSGISEEDLKKIFDPFFTTKEEGTGLGLPVCYGIVKAHGGELKYKSRIGKGTTATVLLPIWG
jgi:PAS domain S-box-containing protein